MIIFRNATVASFRSDRLEGADWYQPGTRAHANCVENLPVSGAIVFVITMIGLRGSAVDTLCVIVLIARICQSMIHLFHRQTDAFVAARFSFFSVQLACFLGLIVMAAHHG